ncbi:hypothetical protein [Comamonas sp. Y33R10-2]|uniref:hypothetical protein n=1 Tax=Comamonas sp. Y33R10-2 TaxID=2853257 RepID=UPI0021083B6A|nr:hypothetical protein [Comamonas sp. Y33R10-2]
MHLLNRPGFSSDYEDAVAAFLARLKPQTERVQALAFDAFFEVANLLYYGPWMAERVVGARGIYEEKPEALLAVYFGSIGVKHSCHALACALLADAVGLIATIGVGYAMLR